MKLLSTIILGLLLMSCGKDHTETIKVINTKTYMKKIRCRTITNSFKECLIDEYADIVNVTLLQNYSAYKCEEDSTFFYRGAILEVTGYCDGLFHVEYIVK